MTTTAEALPEIYRATEELVTLALAVRRDWAERDIRDALTGAAHKGVEWPQALTRLPQLMIDPRAKPADLVPGVHSPFVKTPGAEPTDAYREIRAAMRRPA